MLDSAYGSWENHSRDFESYPDGFECNSTWCPIDLNRVSWTSTSTVLYLNLVICRPGFCIIFFSNLQDLQGLGFDICLLVTRLHVNHVESTLIRENVKQLGWLVC